MANARSRFDAISSYLQRSHEAQAGVLYGKPCLMLGNEAFAAYQPDAMAFRLHGRSLTQALRLPGAKGWDPLHADASAPGWVLVPAEHVLQWDRLAMDAVRCAREASERRISYATVPAPPQVEAPPASDPAALAQRVASAVTAGFGSLTLSDIDRKR
jgi:hypothetical protein